GGGGRRAEDEDRRRQDGRPDDEAAGRHRRGAGPFILLRSVRHAAVVRKHRTSVIARMTSAYGDRARHTRHTPHTPRCASGSGPGALRPRRDAGCRRWRASCFGAARERTSLLQTHARRLVMSRHLSFMFAITALSFMHAGCGDDTAPAADATDEMVQQVYAG